MWLSLFKPFKDVSFSVIHLDWSAVLLKVWLHASFLWMWPNSALFFLSFVFWLQVFVLCGLCTLHPSFYEFLVYGFS